MNGEGAIGSQVGGVAAIEGRRSGRTLQWLGDRHQSGRLTADAQSAYQLGDELNEAGERRVADLPE
ncbi:hypothetical protein PF010_g31031 [Phytophthora fragariae]|uniref:Uncharacterized protein n=1 Tax=Phytophthora fragariae TaxID=53985 RepID=A0A6A3VBX7_9STRA|nr:hypothetical protein PF010_g31031 [Phytophthora fragariae]KAE9164747.1 hypothetical protein PF002_g31530 [Phytophthora fragariae]